MTALATPRTAAQAAGASPARVCAVLVVHNGMPWLPDHLDALVLQTRLPDVMVVVDAGSTDGSAEFVSAHRGLAAAIPDLTLLRLDATVSLGRALERGVAALDARDARADATPTQADWLWVLHDDGAPEARALEQLLAAVRRSPSVAVAGPKLVQWNDPRRFVQLGYQLTRTGRLLPSPRFGEPDQGQYDNRTDTLAVPSNGMLVRRDAYAELGGFDEHFDQYGADLDFGWRAQLAGHRVVVVPDAVLREASAMVAGDRLGAPAASRVLGRQRRAARQVALTHTPWPLVPFMAAWLALGALAGALGLLLAKRPRAAWTEFADLGALRSPWRGIAARRRHRGTKRVRGRHLGSLFVPASAAVGRGVEAVTDAVTPQFARPDPAPAAIPVAEPGPVADESIGFGTLPPSLPRRIVANPGFLATLLALLATVVTWRQALGSGILSATTQGVAGGELHAVTADASGLWHTVTDSWHGAGLGTGEPTSPALAVLAALTWLAQRLPGVSDGRSPVGATVAWLLLAAIPLSTVAAYLAGRVVTRTPWSRALVALAWGTSGVLVSALAQGRVTAVIAHIVLPLAMAGFALAAGRTGTYTAAFATALGCAVLAACIPPLLFVTVLAGLLLLLFGPGTRRWRGLIVAVVPVALLGPWVLRFVADPLLLLSGPGLLDTSGAVAPPWQMALGHPEPTASRFVWLGAPVVALAVLAMLRHTGNRARAVSLLALGGAGLIGLTAALASSHVVLGTAPTGPGASQPATLWAGVGLQLYLAALLGAVLLGSVGMSRWLGSRRLSIRRVFAVATVAGLALATAGSAALAARRGLGDILHVGRSVVPAVAAEEAGGPMANRLLLVSPGSEVIDYQLIGVEPGELLRDVERSEAVDDPGVRDATAALLGIGAGATTTSDRTISDGAVATAPTTNGPGSVHERLVAQAIGFVALRDESVSSPTSGAGDDTATGTSGSALTDSARNPQLAALVRRLDATAGLTRLGGNDERILWRVLPLTTATGAVPPARAHLATTDTRPLQALPVSGPHAGIRDGVQVPPADADRVLVVAEPSQWALRAKVSVDGQEVAARPAASPGGATRPSYPMPRSGGQVRIVLEPEYPRWRAAQGIAVVVVAFLAIPFGTRRSRRRT